MHVQYLSVLVEHLNHTGVWTYCMVHCHILECAQLFHYPVIDTVDMWARKVQNKSRFAWLTGLREDPEPADLYACVVW